MANTQTTRFVSLLAVILSQAIRRTFGAIGADGNCSLYILAPFRTHDWNPIIGLNGNIRTNIGFSQMAAALLAVNHFNERDASVIPEVASIPVDSNITLDISKVLNAYYLDYTALRYIGSHGPSCAMIGPYDDTTATDMKALAQSHSVPLITTRTFDITITSHFYGQFSSSMFPDLVSSARMIAEFLIYKGRTSYVAFLYDLEQTNLQRREALGIALDENNIIWASAAFGDDSQLASRSALAAMSQIKALGYRTIVVSLTNPFYSYELIANAAEQLDMNSGGHLYLWYDQYEPAIFMNSTNPNINKLTEGSTWITPPPQQYIDENDPFLAAWGAQGEDFVKTLNELNPIPPGEVGYVNASADFMQTVMPEPGSSLAYDAVMAVGIAAANAQQSTRAEVAGDHHQAAIRNSSFSGASGPVRFGHQKFGREGSRDENTVLWAAVNFLPHPDYFQVSDIADPENTSNPGWAPVNATIYADGSTSPPKLLRDQPEQNYLPDAIRYIGLTFMSLTILLAIVCAGFVYLNRNHRILKASQPPFLYLICLGAAVIASTVVPSSFDESDGWSQTSLDRACMAGPWLIVLGFILIYGALFSKLMRVNQVLQFSRRRKVKIKHVAAPLFSLLLASLATLIAFTIVAPLRWVRKEINSTTGESIGACESNHSAAFITPLVVLMAIPLMLTGYFAFKTRDVDERFSEANWVFSLVLVQMQLLVVAVPLMILLRDQSYEGQYFGLVCLVVLIGLTTLGLLFFPKMIAYRQAVIGDTSVSKHKRGERGNSRVSGVNVSSGSSPEENNWQNVSYQSNTSGAAARSSVLSNVQESSEENKSSDIPPPEAAAFSSVSVFRDEQNRNKLLATKGEAASSGSYRESSPDHAENSGGDSKNDEHLVFDSSNLERSEINSTPKHPDAI